VDRGRRKALRGGEEGGPIPSMGKEGERISWEGVARGAAVSSRGGKQKEWGHTVGLRTREKRKRFGGEGASRNKEVKGEPGIR